MALTKETKSKLRLSIVPLLFVLLYAIAIVPKFTILVFGHGTVVGTMEPKYWKVTSNKTGVHYDVRYEYEVGGKRYKGSGELQMPPFQSGITVHYSKIFPAFNSAIELPKKSDLIIFGGVLFFFLSCILVLWFPILRFWNTKKGAKVFLFLVYFLPISIIIGVVIYLLSL